jgi:hypothetical protein
MSIHDLIERVTATRTADPKVVKKALLQLWSQFLAQQVNEADEIRPFHSVSTGKGIIGPIPSEEELREMAVFVAEEAAAEAIKMAAKKVRDPVAIVSLTLAFGEWVSGQETPMEAVIGATNWRALELTLAHFAGYVMRLLGVKRSDVQESLTERVSMPQGFKEYERIIPKMEVRSAQDLTRFLDAALDRLVAAPEMDRPDEDVVKRWASIASSMVGKGPKVEALLTEDQWATTIQDWTRQALEKVKSPEVVAMVLWSFALFLMGSQGRIIDAVGRQGWDSAMAATSAMLENLIRFIRAAADKVDQQVGSTEVTTESQMSIEDMWDLALRHAKEPGVEGPEEVTVEGLLLDSANTLPELEKRLAKVDARIKGYRSRKQDVPQYLEAEANKIRLKIKATKAGATGPIKPESLSEATVYPAHSPRAKAIYQEIKYRKAKGLAQSCSTCVYWRQEKDESPMGICKKFKVEAHGAKTCDHWAGHPKAKRHRAFTRSRQGGGDLAQRTNPLDFMPSGKGLGDVGDESRGEHFAQGILMMEELITARPIEGRPGDVALEFRESDTLDDLAFVTHTMDWADVVEAEGRIYLVVPKDRLEMTISGIQNVRGSGGPHRVQHSRMAVRLP